MVKNIQIEKKEKEIKDVPAVDEGAVETKKEEVKNKAKDTIKEKKYTDGIPVAPEDYVG